ncbi:MAG: glycosyltransferase family 9 protein [Dehalococcoidia bacterium]
MILSATQFTPPLIENSEAAVGRRCIQSLSSDPAFSSALGLEPASIVIVRALQLGDLHCPVPALRSLRATLPRATITLIGLPWARDFVQRFDRYLDGFLEFPGYPGLVEQSPEIQRIPAFLEMVQRRHFDLALQMHGSGGISNPLTLLLGARETAGFYVPGQFCPDERLFFPYPDQEPEIVRHLRLLQGLGICMGETSLEFPIRGQDRLELQPLLAEAGLRAGHYVCIHTGARDGARRWPPERFAAVGTMLMRRGDQVVLAGSREEMDLVYAVAAALPQPPVIAAGRTSLGALAALFASARLVVCNDTGVSHLADAIGTPSVVIVSASDLVPWGRSTGVCTGSLLLKLGRGAASNSSRC